MPFCKKCGRGLPLDAEFCSNCGNPVEGKKIGYEAQNDTYTQNPPSPPKGQDDGAARRQRLIDNFYLRMKWEHKAWSIAGKVYTIIGAICAGISLLALMATIIARSEASAFFGVYAYVFFVYALVILPHGVIGLVMKGKLQKYMDGLYHDCGPAITRGESVGMIVFNAIFHPVALVFYIINFITIKEHREEFEEIRRLQLQAAGNTVYYE